MKRAFVNKLFTVLMAMLLSTGVYAEVRTYTNPILPGGYPDPSICRAEGYYYIVNSTFEYFPGLPIHRSKDLVNWELVGHAMHTESQAKVLGFYDIQQGGGIHAPTIRYHDGVFYVITTSVYSPLDGSYAKMYNFISTATDPAGEWSEPHLIEGAVGIDPDIFFDDTGKVWYVGTCNVGDNYENGIGEIWTQELDLEKWELVGKRTSLWRGACGGFCTEGPHMYKKDGMYYLLIAEGGTDVHHAVMISASEHILGPYVSNERNPILTSRHLSYNNWVHSTGHADLVELEDGRWYMVCLGIRGDQRVGPRVRSNMGRETHLMAVTWEREPFDWKPTKYEWPVVEPVTGMVGRANPILPFEGMYQYRNDAFYDGFDSSTLNLKWNFRRIPLEDLYSLSAKPGSLRLNLKPEAFELRARYGVMGFRQTESDFEYKAKMNFNPKKVGAEAGISLFQRDDNYINMTIKREESGTYLNLYYTTGSTNKVSVASEKLDGYDGDIIFKVVTNSKCYQYYYSLDGGNTFKDVATTSPTIILSQGYTGSYLGVYGSSNGIKSKEYADFDWVSYKGFQRR